MKFSLLLSFYLAALQLSLAQKTEATFEVTFKGDKIGTLHALEDRSGSQLVKDLRTVTDTKVIMMSIHVESEVSITHIDGALIKGTAYRHANRGAEDVHAHVTRIDDTSYEVERNGRKEKMENVKIDFCVIDLFFREPRGMKTIFSNMYAQMLTIKNVGAGKYMLVTPDNKNSYYTYQNGKLMTVETDTPVGKVVSTRI